MFYYSARIHRFYASDDDDTCSGSVESENMVVLDTRVAPTWNAYFRSFLGDFDAPEFPRPFTEFCDIVLDLSPGRTWYDAKTDTICGEDDATGKDKVIAFDAAVERFEDIADILRAAEAMTAEERDEACEPAFFRSMCGYGDKWCLRLTKTAQ